ncbi:hypothetical protein R1sor_015901 [Riccia sorocarpa]|uniref:Uncharacterized protein n=1 Tax=Riccia sorocarpa TaxID=122646 RepID=A0ABD3HGN1_9MARC
MKDRAALFIIKDAEEKGLLRPGGVIVERRTMDEKGYRCLIGTEEMKYLGSKRSFSLVPTPHLVVMVPFPPPAVRGVRVSSHHSTHPYGGPQRAAPLVFAGLNSEEHFEWIIKHSCITVSCRWTMAEP